MKSTVVMLIASLTFATASFPCHAQDDSELALRAQNVLKKYCYACHGLEKEARDLNVLDHTVLTTQIPGETGYYVLPGKPDESYLWHRMALDKDEPMPPEGEPRPDSEELELVRTWIEKGASAAATNTDRELITPEMLLTAIRTDILSKESRNRPTRRYLSIANAHNNSRFTEKNLRTFRAGLSKLLNSLSDQPDIILPDPIPVGDTKGENAVLFAIDLREFGWKVETWQSALNGYPYGMTWDGLEELIDEIEALLGGDAEGDGLAYVRADWFIHNASRPPAYHRFLDLPDSLEELEERIGVNVADDFKNNQLLRAGFGKSGVSRHNRLVDRHTANSGYYYRSYDFGKSHGRAVLSRFPLGPSFEGKDGTFFPERAFEHDGGEVFYSMPNGLQAYLLVDQAEKRLDEAPIQIVRDRREYAGSPVIVNGISCMGCHKDGILPYRDDVRGAHGLSMKEEREKLLGIYANPDELEKRLLEDKARFAKANRKAIGPYLLVGEDASKPLEQFHEPITQVAKWYDADLDPITAAADLHMKPEQLKSAFATNRFLKTLGAGPLGQGKEIPRGMWDTMEGASVSLFQRMAERMGKGIPKHPF